MRRVLAVALFLPCFAALAWLRPSSVSYDGLAFVLGARSGALDYGHALFLPLLRSVSWTGLPPVLGAQLCASAGLAVALLLLARHLLAAGARPAHAWLVAALFAVSTLIWQEAGAIEPTTWTLAALLAAGAASARYAGRPRVTRLALFLGALAVALGFHLVSLCALPWLALRARGTAPRPRAHALVLLGALGLVLGAAFRDGRLPEFLRYWSGFLPTGELGPELSAHVARGARLLAEGAPVLVLLGLASFPFEWRSRLREGLVLALPYGLAFLVLGKPLVGLLAPLILAAALGLGRGATAATRRWGERRVSLGLAGALALQLALTLPQAIEWHRAPDLPRQRAELLARYLTAGTLLFSGALTNHLRFYCPEVELVSLPELLHAARVRSPAADPIEVVREEVRRAARRCALSSDGASYLQQWSGNPERLGISIAGAFLVPEDPKLALFPLTAP
ncbi:MAG: hypothetical protein EXS08_15015 [Planctomycetes bacterium]|nr:hypothetical protein [Planctomycetota bacterium]